jgi:hypothetical protein
MEDQKTYAWIKSNHCEVLELPRIFMAKILRTAIANSGVRPDHYIHLMDMVVGSPDFDDFVRRCNSVGSVWKSIENLDKIHETEIETELRAMEDLARKRRPIKLAKALAMTFGVPGCRPVPIRVSSYFSAAIEYLESSIRKIVRGAKPRKNDRGMFVDWQLLNYLADPGLQFLTEENFSGEIAKSPQRHRIVKLEALN